MITYFQSLVLAFVQAATELLPISSSGHLIIFSEILGIDSDMTLIEILHFPTLIAIVIVFRSKIVEIFRQPLPKLMKFSVKVLLSLLPAVLLAFLIEDLLESHFYNLQFIAYNLIFWGVLMIWIEKNETKYEKTEEFAELNYKQAFIIGIGQMLALIPGTSRSGVTTMTGMITGLKKQSALEYSFIVGIPLIAGSIFYSAIKDRELIELAFTPQILIGMLAALIFAIFFGWLINKYKKDKFLTFFGYYRIILGFILLGLILVS